MGNKPFGPNSQSQFTGGLGAGATPYSGASTTNPGAAANYTTQGTGNRWFDDLSSAQLALYSDDPRSALIAYLKHHNDYSYSYAQELSKFNPYNIAFVLGTLPELTGGNEDKLAAGTDVLNKLRQSGYRFDIDQIYRNISNATYEEGKTGAESLAFLIDNAQDLSPETSAGTFQEIVLSSLQGLIPTEGLNALQLFLNARAAEYVQQMYEIESGDKPSFKDWLVAQYGSDMGMTGSI